MDRKNSTLQGIVAGLGLLVLILDGAIALEGARTGIELCIKNVIPSMFPFFVLSMTLTNALSQQCTETVSCFARFLGIPSSAVSVVIPAFLGGYPVGAKCIGDLYDRGQITKSEAERLLAFCSNAGPSFLFGMVSVFFPDKKWTWLLWFIHIFSAVLTAAAIPSKSPVMQKSSGDKKAKEVHIVLSAAKAMCQVCCWVILFRTVIAFLEVWFFWLFPAWVQVLLFGLLELTIGCCELSTITSLHFRFILCACMLSFGGICVLLQTASVTKGLTLGYYIKGKLLQTLFSLILSWGFVSENGGGILLILAALITIFRKTQNHCRNPEAHPV